jgi:ABC-type uncharacterized transport system fused permease/ATPase subunit
MEANAVAVEAEEPLATTGPSGEEIKIVMNESDIVTPRGDCIVGKMSFSVTPGQGLMVTGRGGTGKTSFARGEYGTARHSTARHGMAAW